MASNGVGINIFITGANRGIGLGLVKELCKIGGVKNLFAGCRDPSKAKELKELQSKSGSPVKIIQIDVQNDVSIISAVAQVDKVISATGGGLNVLINNSGVLDKSGGISATHPDRQVYARHFDVNVMGVAMSTAAFLPLIRRAGVAGQAAKIVNISSLLASTADLKAAGAIFGGNIVYGMSKACMPLIQRASMIGQVAKIVNISSQIASTANVSAFAEFTMFHGNIIYGMSKAALNHYTTGLAIEVKDTNIVTIALCPGWVRTDMGGDTAPLSLEESVTAIAKLISSLKKEHSGMYLDRFGKPINY